jgi:hypothetical protein
MPNKYYKTSSFNLACFLASKGFELANIDKTDPRRCIFIFIDQPEREHLVQVFNFGKENDPKVIIDVRKFITATKQIKNALYQDNF